MKSGFKGLALASTVGLGAVLISGCNGEEAPPASPPPSAPAAVAPAPAPSKDAAPAPNAGEEKKDDAKAEAPAAKEG